MEPNSNHQIKDHHGHQLFILVQRGTIVSFYNSQFQFVGMLKPWVFVPSLLLLW
ncbi:hypothetical protein SORBI_3005G002050 [Sorghum bicolor]|nr:hypothetical protein SORBI_3005G002050 [Sorghum bicolor]